MILPHWLAGIVHKSPPSPVLVESTAMTDTQETQLVATVAETAAFALSGPQLAALVSAVSQLVIEVEAIRANAVAAWTEVQTDFTAAADAWNTAVETPIVQAALADPNHFNDARLSGAAASAPVPAPDASGLSSVTVSLGAGVQQQT